ncbi:hypothetical protein PoB_000760700 [Plakobranchus ocellatus]|uniref:Uncharacterized protein n=1 Tax=Plakobranchus ocellatus TaxID=259542 RepID=A0AAV3YF67_9GAST|nr:hypothetical protein PoB_000760700 [Plakobranchus ocellatus]
MRTSHMHTSMFTGASLSRNVDYMYKFDNGNVIATTAHLPLRPKQGDLRLPGFRKARASVTELEPATARYLQISATVPPTPQRGGSDIIRRLY